MGAWKCPVDPLLSYPSSHLCLSHSLQVTPISGKFLLWHGLPAALLSCWCICDNFWSQSKRKGCKAFDLSPSTTAAESVSVLFCLCGISLHQVECWAPPLLGLIVKASLVRNLMPEVCAQIWTWKQWSKNESITLSIRLMSSWRSLAFASPHLIWNCSQLPISFWFVHLLLYPLLIKSASFPSLCCARWSHSLQACTYSRIKGHWGIFELERICLSQDVMNHPEDTYLCQLPLCILPFDLGWWGKKFSGVKWK